jgi:biopolymer transport protein ExbB/TolQ
MYKLLAMTGPFGILLLLLATIILVLSIVTAIRMNNRGTVGEHKFKNGLNGILFWGCISAVLGLLGQFSGLWRALGVISKATVISPKLVAIGLMESFSTTIMGLVILVISAVIWFTLRSLSQRTTNTA